MQGNADFHGCSAERRLASFWNWALILEMISWAAVSMVAHHWSSYPIGHRWLLHCILVVISLGSESDDQILLYKLSLFRRCFLGMWEGRKHSVLESHVFQCKREEDILGLVCFYSLWIRQNWNALSGELGKWWGDNSCAVIPERRCQDGMPFISKGWVAIKRSA